MPELASLRSYRLPSLRYTPPRFDVGPAPTLAPSTAAGAGLRGNALSMGTVADTLAALPDLITGGVEKGRKLAEREQVGRIKMGALQNGLSNEERKAYAGMVFGADNSVALKPENPELELLKAQALAGRLNAPTPYEAVRHRITGAPLPASGALSGGIRPALPQSSANNAATGVVDEGVTGEVIPPLPGNEQALPDVANLPAPTPAPGSFGALSGGFQFGAGAAPATGVLSGGATSPVIQQPVEPAPALGKTREYEESPGIFARETDGVVTHRFYPGAKDWEKVARPTAPKAVAGESVAAGEAMRVLGITPAQWATMPEAEKQAAAQRIIELNKAEKIQGFTYNTQAELDAAIAENKAKNLVPDKITQIGDKLVVTGWSPKDNRPERLTESESATQRYLKRGAEAEADLAGINYNASGVGAIIQKAAANNEWLNLGLDAIGKTDPEAQRFYRGATEFINAINRRDSGAAISAIEWKSAMDRYFQRAGDSPQVIADKAKARKTALDALAESLPDYAKRPTATASPAAATPATAPKVTNNLPRLNSIEEFNALPVGAWFLDDEGIPKQKK